MLKQNYSTQVEPYYAHNPALNYQLASRIRGWQKIDQNKTYNKNYNMYSVKQD